MSSAETTSKVRVCSVAEIVDGEIKGADLPDGQRVALYKVGDRFYATSDTCTHGEASLSEEGLLSGHVVECTWHFGTFDVTTGAALTSPCSIALKTFPVEIVDGDVYVGY
ncbi:non-heme iron oxygenase ferredoxin subunit [Bradyrhizobium sp. AUGA SZCCT0240]|uniref:non-heme iron oxygenase ferredoxin subunit n=1 Tax=Bradyrhizobium sp. AUGA SZCCT0240 TaxID=2807669 RepID=UPI001BA4D25E|nr:non-heme iron oxygenase ferredoxin subunit [Bradyrhizobium sp. AUGA SZCCT0240]MBR1252299.1 non-heme iron oxygenase ferredoxin subunit [Bradyrhizobium sp. AUGA SZCCT0240]